MTSHSGATPAKINFVRPCSTDLLGVHVVDRMTAFAVGRAGTVVRWNGAEWTNEDAATTEDLYAVFAASPDDVYAVGGNLTVGGESLVCTHAAGHWTTARSGIQSLLLSADGAHGVVRAVGFNGGVVEQTAAGWRELGAYTNEHLFCIRATGDGGWLVCGLNGTLARIDASGTQPYAVTNAHLTCVTPGPAQIAVGFFGTILRADGETWSHIESPTREHLWSVWSDREDHALIVGARGTLLAWDGRSITPVPTPTQEDLHSISGADGLVVAVGRRGTILSTDGTDPVG